MPRRFFDIAFTPSVQAEQSRHGSRTNYAKFAERRSPTEDQNLGDEEIDFIADRDSFYLGTVSETGWPYVQHRGGQRGFVRVLDGQTLGWADFAGNRQYVSIGNAAANDRVALFFMDYPSRSRLKILGRMRKAELGDNPGIDARLRTDGYNARTEHAVLVTVEGFDWNCPQHITPRFSEAQVHVAVEHMQSEIDRLKALIVRLGGSSDR